MAAASQQDRLAAWPSRLRFQLFGDRKKRHRFYLFLAGGLLILLAFASLISGQLAGIQLICLFVTYSLLASHLSQLLPLSIALNLAHLALLLASLLFCSYGDDSSQLVHPVSPLISLFPATNCRRDPLIEYLNSNTQQPPGNSIYSPKIPGWLQLAVLAYCYAIYHLVGLRLSRRELSDCRKSLNDIRRCVAAKIATDAEQKLLTRLMESVIPKHLVGRMREDIMLSQNKGIFHRIYLDSYDEVSILFADIVNFTKISSTCSAQLLVETLNELFGRFDKAADRNNCLRIKILGDCYYCVSGIPDKSDQHALRSVQMGLDMIDILGEIAQHNSSVDLNMRVGIHSGRVLCGILGKKKWQFDVHSNDVKLANHTEQSGVPGRVHITEDTLRALGGRFEVEPAKGHLRDAYIAELNISTYFVVPPRSANQLMSNEMEIATRPQSASGLPLADRSGGARSASLGTSNQLARIRFRLATQRIINALHFIRTIDAPFADITGVTGDQPEVAESPSGEDLADGEQTMVPSGPQKLNEFELVTSTNNTNGGSLNAVRPSDRSPRVGLPDVVNEANVESAMQQMLDASRPQLRGGVDSLSLRFRDPRMGALYREDKISQRGRHRPLVQLLGLLALLGLPLLLLAFVSAPELPAAHTPPSDSAGQPPPSHQLAELVQRFGLGATMCLMLLIALLIYLHHTELQGRRNFLWRQLALEDKDRIAIMRDCNRFIFFNLLPPHVASYFLESRRQRKNDHHKQQTTHQELYHKSYDQIGVVFATISNFSDFYSEVQGNNHGLECLRLLNEIICDFDSILDDERFKAVDKIKTIGSTYMAAIGLFPEHELPASLEPELEQDASSGLDELTKELSIKRRQVASFLQILVNFVMEMKSQLEEINEHSYNCFKLKVGINLGPVTAGVIGASKPQYDIWGNTVNVASRMESTAEPNKIQITQEVYQVLKDFNEDCQFKFTCRGSINVKGKGYMTTYYLEK